MSDDLPSPAPTPRAKSKRRWLRGLFVGVVGFLLLLFGLGTWLYQDQTFFLNQVLGRLPQVNLSVGHARINLQGDFEVRDVVWKAPSSEEKLAEITSISGELDWKELYEGRVRKLEIQNPKLHLDPWLKSGKRLEALPRLSPVVEEVVEATRAKHEPSLSPTTPRDYHLGALEIHQVELNVAGVTTRVDLGVVGLHLKDGVLQSIAGLEVKGKVEGLGADASTEAAQVQVQAHLKDRVLNIAELQISEFRLEAALWEKLQQLLPEKSKAPVPTEPGTMGEIQDFGFDQVHLGRLAFQRFQWKLDDVYEGISTSGTLDFEATALDWKVGESWLTGELALTLEPMTLLSEKNREGVQAMHSSLAVELKESKTVVISRFDATGWRLRWGPELQEVLSRLGGNTEEKNTSEPVKVELREMRFQRADLEIALGEADHEQLVIRSLADFKLQNVAWDGVDWEADALQRLEVTQLWVGYPNYPYFGNTVGFVEIPRGLLEIQPEKWKESFHVEHLELESPKLRLSAHLTPWWDEKETIVTAAQDSEFRVPFWKRLHFHELLVDEGLLEFDMDPANMPRVAAKWEVKTQLRNDEVSIHQFHFHEVAAHLPEKLNAPFPVLHIPTLELEVKLPDFWTHRHLEALRLANASIEANDKLIKSLSGESAPSTAPQEERLSLMKAWTVGKLDFVESYLSVNQLIPGIPTIRFGVDFRTENTPLELSALQSHLEPQKVVLSQINIPSPYQPLRSVAQLEEVILTFSLEGLAQQRIDSVQIQRPKVYVGEDLFWYIDYYRNYRPELVLQDMALGWSVLRETQPISPVWQVPFEELTVFQSLRELNENWSVTHLEVNDGELILAPKGKPIEGFKKPFPFNLSTELAKGTLEAELDIPIDTYTLPDLKLELVGMRGEVLFNLPLKARDNNLVETFEVDAIRWKDLKTGSAYLTLTYDAMGIYAKFGAEAYEGYVNGEVNVYLDDSYHWDGWISGKAIATKPITDQLSTAYFMLDGKVDLTVIGQGSKSEIYQADLEFVNATQGELSIRALNDMIEELSADPQEISNQLNQVALEALRDFQYDEAIGKARIYGREGKGNLTFKGPYGSRNFEINVFDHRWKVDDLEF